jgi:hypothetical protein
MLAESLPNAPAVLSLDLRRGSERSPTICLSEERQIRNFGTMLEPRYIVGTEPLDQ